MIASYQFQNGQKTSRPRKLVSGVKMNVAIDKLGLRFHLFLTLSFSQPQREVLPSTTHISLERSICMKKLDIIDVKLV